MTQNRNGETAPDLCPAAGEAPAAGDATDACQPVGGMRFRACPVCGGELMEIRAKLQCTRCHTICETCCEGGRG